MYFWLTFALSITLSTLFGAEKNPLIAATQTVLQGCDADIRTLIDKQDYKAAIQGLNERLNRHSDPSKIYILLATSYLHDQQEEQALEAFMQAIKYAKCSRQSPSKQELALFSELQQQYLETGGIGEPFCSKLQSTIEKYPDYLTLQFFLAAERANARKFDDFFSLFYRCYLAHPDCYLAYKSQGVVASLLLQRSRSFEEKQKWRTESLHFLKRASKEVPQDVSIHKMLVYTALPQERKEIVSCIIRTIVETNVVIPRKEIPFYVLAALEVNDVVSAKLFLDKASSWYEYSRVITQMQELIEQQK